MITRIYVDNFRCLTNFEFKVKEDKNALFIGGNGAGKSSLLKILYILKRIAYGDNTLADKFTKEEYGFSGTKKPIVFEIDVETGRHLFSYGIKVEPVKDLFDAYYMEETKLIGGNKQEVYPTDRTFPVLKKKDMTNWICIL